MGERWIVGYDGSRESQTAVEWARYQASGRDVELDVVHAARAPVAEPDRRRTDGGPSFEPDTTIVTGSPGRALVDAAHHASLLVVGRHGAGGWRRSLGSVSRYCVTHSPVPTVVVPPTWDPGPVEQVVIGFDGSAHANAALIWATEFCGEDTDLRALIAIEIAPWLREEVIRTRLGDELSAEEHRLRELLDQADPAGRTRCELVTGDARPALAQAADRSDLVVLGAHGAGRLGAILGSVVGWMLDGSPTPVVVVPLPAPETARST